MRGHLALEGKLVWPLWLRIQELKQVEVGIREVSLVVHAVVSAGCGHALATTARARGRGLAAALPLRSVSLLIELFLGLLDLLLDQIGACLGAFLLHLAELVVAHALYPLQNVEELLLLVVEEA